jgi:peptidoglycan hydrolase CwlO-like protein
MSISSEDLNELRRLATNTYEQEKSAQIHRIIRGVNELESKLRELKSENDKLKSEINSIKTG